MLIEIGQKAKETSYILGKMGTDLKNAGLLAAAQEILDEEDEILKANAADVAKAKERGMAPGLVDRLELNHKRIEGIVEGMRQVVGLEDPVGEVISMKRRPNGLLIGQKRVPFGVIGIIYEARPNVTADAFALCFKTGNAVILRGGSDALESNKAIVAAIRNGLKKERIPEDAISLIEDTSHETAREFMRMNGYLDVLIPRGGAGLIRTVVENSTVPVIETGTGNCHIYVDESADFDMALDIIFNAKTQRIGVCNACESTLVHRKIAKEFLPLMKKRLDEKNVEIRADEGARSIVPEFTAATEEDWEKVGQDLFEKLAAELSTPNENRSFCFRDVKNYETHTEYHEDAKQWTVRGIAEISYDGIILPTGVTDQNIYLKINFGSFRIDRDGNRYTLHPTGTDHG